MDPSQEIKSKSLPTKTSSSSDYYQEMLIPPAIPTKTREKRKSPNPVLENDEDYSCMPLPPTPGSELKDVPPEIPPRIKNDDPGFGPDLSDGKITLQERL